MGDPRKPRKKYLPGKPRKLWNKQLLEEELRLLGEYGLRNKRELWRARAMLKAIKERARRIQALPLEERINAENELKNRLYRAGFIGDTALPLDAVLSLDVRAILERRLQSIVYRRGLARSLSEARLLITHGHIAVNGRVVRSPGYLVPRDLEDKVTYAINSPRIAVQR